MCICVFKYTLHTLYVLQILFHLLLLLYFALLFCVVFVLINHILEEKKVMNKLQRRKNWAQILLLYGNTAGSNQLPRHEPVAWTFICTLPLSVLEWTKHTVKCTFYFWDFTKEEWNRKCYISNVEFSTKIIKYRSLTTLLK